MKATKIKMKPGCKDSKCTWEIDSIYIDGFYSYKKKEEVYDYLVKKPVFHSG